jgi:hypothetical protein
MTDQIAALGALVDLAVPERQLALDEFYAQWQKEPLVILKWLGLQVSCGGWWGWCDVWQRCLLCEHERLGCV